MAKEQTFEHPPRGHVALLVYDPTNDRFNVVQGDDVDTAIPATGKALLASALAHGYDGSAWHKLPLVWGYTGSVVEDLGGTQSGAGTYSKYSDPVPAGTVWRIEALVGQNNTRNPSYVALYLNNGVTPWPVGFAATPGAAVPTIVLGPFTLGPGHKIGIDIGGCSDGDTITAVGWGWAMDVDM